MLEATITHRVEAPDLVNAINNLAGALKGVAGQPCAPFDSGIPKAPATPAIPAAPVAPAVPVAPATPAAPVAEVAPVTFDMIVAAGSQLLDAGRMNDLLNLLKGFGVQAITQLKPEQYVEVAVALRGLGASI